MALDLTTSQGAIIASLDALLDLAMRSGVTVTGGALLPALPSYADDRQMGGVNAAATRTLVKQNFESILAAYIVAVNVGGTGVTKCYASYFISVAQNVISVVTPAILNFDTTDIDTDNAVTTGAAWHFTVPANKPGEYRVSCKVEFAAAANVYQAEMSLYKNGVEARRLSHITLGVGRIGNFTLGGEADVTCVPGDTLDVRMFQFNDTSTTYPTAIGLPLAYITILGPIR